MDPSSHLKIMALGKETFCPTAGADELEGASENDGDEFIEALQEVLQLGIKAEGQQNFQGLHQNVGDAE